MSHLFPAMLDHSNSDWKSDMTLRRLRTLQRIPGPHEGKVLAAGLGLRSFGREFVRRDRFALLGLRPHS